MKCKIVMNINFENKLHAIIDLGGLGVQTRLRSMAFFYRELKVLSVIPLWAQSLKKISSERDYSCPSKTPVSN